MGFGLCGTRARHDAINSNVTETIVQLGIENTPAVYHYSPPPSPAPPQLSLQALPPSPTQLNLHPQPHPNSASSSAQAPPNSTFTPSPTPTQPPAPPPAPPPPISTFTPSPAPTQPTAPPPAPPPTSPRHQPGMLEDFHCVSSDVITGTAHHVIEHPLGASRTASSLRVSSPQPQLQSGYTDACSQ